MKEQPRTTGIKHLYKQLAMATNPMAYPALLAIIAGKHGISAERLLSIPMYEVIEWMDDIEDFDSSMSLTAVNAFRAWKEYGCQTFSLDEQTVDMLACTAAPDLNDLVQLDRTSTMDEWNIPYPCFAIELPYPTALVNSGETEYFTAAIAMPFGEKNTKQVGWSLIYLTPGDVAGGVTSVANGTSVLSSMITNLCVFLNEGGGKQKAGKRIGFEKAAKKAKAKVNIWNVRSPSETVIPMGIARPYLLSGENPPKSFKVGTRFMVRGHWRKQPHGPGRTEIRRTWIKPHMKGPEEGEAFSRIYSVKGKV